MTYVEGCFVALWGAGSFILLCRIIYFKWQALNHLAPDADPHAAAKWKRKPPSPTLFNAQGQDYRRRALRAEWTLFYWMIGVALLGLFTVLQH